MSTQFLLRIAGTGIAASYLLWAALVYQARPTSVHAANQTSNLAILTASEDKWYNYDHPSGDPSGSNVDWPVRYIFYNSATINKVKWHLNGGNCGDVTGPIMSPQLCGGGSTKRHKEYENYLWFSDSDGGIKEGNDCAQDYHIRVYARASGWDYNYNLAYGRHIFGSVHRDFEGGSCSDYYDSAEEISEDAEPFFNQRIYDYLRPAPYNWGMCTNCYDWLNYESPHWADPPNNDHWVQSNGYTNYILVPGPNGP